MKKKNILTAISLALVLASTEPTTSYAYSDDKLDEVEEKIENYINEEVDTSECVNQESENLEFYYRYIRIQKLICEIPTRYYYNLVDSIKMTNTLKDVFKNFIDDEMRDAAKEAIVYANIANNNQEILDNVMVFFDSRYNGNAFIPELGKFKEFYQLEDIHTLDNQCSLTNMSNKVLIFRDYTSYGNYRVYEITDFASEFGDNYYFITNQNNKVIACVKRVNKNNSYTNLEDENIYITPLEQCLENNGLDKEIKNDYTYDELRDLGLLIDDKLANKQAGRTLVVENMLK